MILQISLFTKAPMTNVAFKWSCTGVDISMGFEITRCWERFAAHCTFMWFFLKKQKISKYVGFYPIDWPIKTTWKSTHIKYKIREDVRGGVAGVAMATPIIQILFVPMFPSS